MGAVPLSDHAGAQLGSRAVSYTDRDVILYALAVGARAGDLDLVHEHQLRVLPTFGLVLGLWTADAAGALGAFRPEQALHGAQQLRVHAPLPATGAVEVTGAVAAVWDKGRSAVLDVVAESPYFTATYSIFLPGQGGWGGERGPRWPSTPDLTGDRPPVRYRTSTEQAALYRLTGDRHLIHIDPTAAREAGFTGPILHGLCTLGIAARELAAASGRHPCDLRTLRARFTAPVMPGDTLAIHLASDGPGQGAGTHFTATVDGVPVLADGAADFVEQA